MIDVRAFGGDPMIWAKMVHNVARGLPVYFDSYGGYITVAGAARVRFDAPCFSTRADVESAIAQHIRNVGLIELSGIETLRPLSSGFTASDLRAKVTRLGLAAPAGTDA